MECLICLSDIENGDRKITCGNPFCTAIICIECMEILIDFSHRDRSMPNCKNKSCQGYYLLEDISNVIEKNILIKYKECYFYDLEKNKETEIKKVLENEEIIKKLREERKIFIDTHFPPAIVKVANIVLKTKLKKIEKQLSNRIKEQLKKAHRICMNAFCDGHLDSDFVCMICSTRFCKECEKELKDDHICDVSDVKSRRFIEDMIKCPNCGIPVEKSDGCNDMTCAHCNTNFRYEDGTKGGGGNHGKNIQIMTKNKILFSNIYKDYLENNSLIDLMIYIEQKEPSKPTQISLIAALKKYYKLKNKDLSIFLKLKVPEEFNKYIKQVYRLKEYHNYMSNIEKLLQQKKLKRSDLLLIKNKIDNL